MLVQASAQAGGSSPASGQTADPSGMVQIPAGEYWMGRTHTWFYDQIDWLADAFKDDRPSHVVFLDAFYMDKYEITNTEYEAFVLATGRAKPWHWSGSLGKITAGQEKWPVYNVTWDDAAAYCAWVGKRLPTEAEWEKAARGGLDRKLYPWGDEVTGIKGQGGGRRGGEGSTPPPPKLARWGFPNGPAPVGSYPPNGYGLFDMTGNVYEWVSDWYDADYYAISPEKNPEGPETGLYKILRGGGWSSGEGVPASATAGRNVLGVHYRNYAPKSQVSNAFGFRCVKSADK